VELRLPLSFPNSPRSLSPPTVREMPVPRVTANSFGAGPGTFGNWVAILPPGSRITGAVVGLEPWLWQFAGPGGMDGHTPTQVGHRAGRPVIEQQRRFTP
jgi:hypothetical protein